MNTFINAAGLVSTHGVGIRKFSDALFAGLSAPKQSQQKWPVLANGRSTAFYFAERSYDKSVRDQLVQNLYLAWQEVEGELPSLAKNYALIFASTKGCSEDFVWQEASPTAQDPFTGIVEDFFVRSQLQPNFWICVSNACASSHSAVVLAKEWIESKRVEQVIIIAADWIGPFVMQGFHSLKALSPSVMRPFSGQRDGLLLGEAAAALVLGHSKLQKTDPKIFGAAIDCEGFAATRPTQTGDSLRRAIQKSLADQAPDIIIAHGTATIANDSAEDCALTPWSAPITCTKWSVGHTLGASGLIDVIAAREILKRETSFAIATCETVDPSFKGNILTPQQPDLSRPQSALITALGFGGIHGAIFIGNTFD
jgi:hypothetical protein